MERRATVIRWYDWILWTAFAAYVAAWIVFGD
jgi:hypothetical protein